MDLQGRGQLMRRLTIAVLAGFALTFLVTPQSAFAQNIEDEIDKALSGGGETKPADGKKGKKVDKSAKASEPGAEPAVAPAVAPAGPTAETAAEDLPQIGEDQLAVFVLNRGFYANGDLGVFLTLGGVRGYSNVQPYVALKAGFDVGNYVSVQLALASGYSSGNALSQNDAPGAGGNETVNYGLFMIGAEVVGAIRPTARFAIEPRVGGGVARIDPQPTDPNIDLRATDAKSVPGLAPQVGGGIDFKYLTLLTDFSAGLSLGGYFVIGPNIPAVSIAGSVRYTF
jgi:hypothetical protein